MRYFDDIEFVKFGEWIDSEQINSRRFDDYYTIQYNHSGTVVLRVDSGPVRRLAGPAVFSTGPGAFFDYRPPRGETRHHFFLCFKGARAERWMATGLLPPYGELRPIGNGAGFSTALLRVMAQLRLPGNRGHDLAVTEVEQLLLQCHDSGSSGIPSHYRQKLEALARELDADPLSERDFHREAAAMNCSYSHFRLMFGMLFGCPPGRYLLECRLNRAAEMLLNSNRSIQEISLLCGFSNEFYFSRVFKKHRSLPPSEFRRR